MSIDIAVFSRFQKKKIGGHNLSKNKIKKISENFVERTLINPQNVNHNRFNTYLLYKL